MKHSVVICDEVFFVDVNAFYLYAECFHHFVCLFLSGNFFFVSSFQLLLQLIQIQFALFFVDCI